MNLFQSTQRRLAAALLLVAAAGRSDAAQSDDKLNVCCTVPSIASIAEEVGGDQVAVTSFAKGGENPHFIDARPSYVKTLSSSDLFIQQGLELEIGWAPLILQQARNGKVLPGARGFLDVSSAITPLERSTGPIDRSMGDVHPNGNPHFMTDPVNGIKVARAIRDRLCELRPAAKPGFEQRCADFEKKVCTALVGEKLASEYPTDQIVKLATLNETGGLKLFLEKQGRLADLGGWLGALLPYSGTKAVSDHNSWVYFGRRFGIDLVGYLEPKPGISPTTSHLGEIVRLVPAQGVKLILVSPGFDLKSGEFVASKTGAKLLVLAHEVHAVEPATSYVAMIDHDVKQIVEALGESP